MVDILDFTDWNEYDGASEGSGRSEKIWLQSEAGDMGLFKFPKIDPATSDITTEHISEHLAHRLGGILEVATAKVDIGRYHERIGSMSYLVSQEGEWLIEGISFISGAFPGYNAEKLMDGNGKYYCIEHILQSTHDLQLDHVWIEMMLFDFLIGNADRHQSNWAVLMSLSDSEALKINMRSCPLYDNGSSLCCYVNQGQIDKLFGKDPGPFRALTDSKSRSIIRIDGGKKALPPHREVVQHLLKAYPITKTIAERFLDRLTEEKIDAILEEYPLELLEPRKNELIRMYLKRKLSILSACLKGGI